MIGSTLKSLLTRQGMNVNELARRTGVSAQTLYSIIKRDNMKIDFDVLLRVCSVLDVPVEVFYSSSSVSTSMPSAEEWELIRKYRQMDESGRELITLVADVEMKRVK